MQLFDYLAAAAVEKKLPQLPLPRFLISRTAMILAALVSLMSYYATLQLYATSFLSSQFPVNNPLNNPKALNTTPIQVWTSKYWENWRG